MNSKSSRSFSVLFFSTYDSMNYWIPPVIDALIEQEHHCHVVVRDKSDLINNKMFLEKASLISEPSEISADFVDNYDFVILPPIYIREFADLISRAIDKGIFTISNSYLFSSIVLRCYPDLVLTSGKSKFEEFKENGLNYSCVALGNPQYDKIKHVKKSSSNIQNVLIVDQGGYPYGKVGKQQFADTIIKMATENPTINFTLKPRYTKEELGFGQTTHQLSESLSDFLSTDLPNFNILNKPVILEEILDQYDAMVSTWSTAFYAAMEADMPLLILEGFDSIDVFDVRKCRIEMAYKHLKKSGAVIHYQKLNYQKMPFLRLDEEFVAHESERIAGSSANALVDLLEFLYHNLHLKNQRILDTFQFSVDDFYFHFQNLEKVDMSNQEIHYYKKLRFELNNIQQEAVYLNRSMCNNLDLSALTSFVEEAKHIVDCTLPISHYTNIALDIIENAKRDLFSSSSMESLMSDDPILQDYFIDWLYETKKYDQIINPSYSFQAVGSLYYNQALIHLPHHKLKSFRLLFLFLDELFLRNNIIVFLKERRLPQSLIPFFKGINKCFLFLFLMWHKKFIIFTYFNESIVASNQIMSYFKFKYLVDSGQSQKASATYQRFMQKFASNSKQKIKNLLFIILMKIERRKIK